MGLIQLKDGSFVDEGLYNARDGEGYSPSADPMQSNGLTDFSMNMTDFNTWASNPANADAAAKMGEAGLTFDDQGVGSFSGTNPFGETGLGMNTKTLSAVTGLGQLGLGYLNYKDSHAMNKQNLKGAKFNLAQARNEADNTAAYRKSYGA